MLFPVVAGLLIFGVGLWLVGHLFQYLGQTGVPLLGIAVIGAVLVLVAGSAITLTGVELRTGEEKTFSYTEFQNDTVRNQTVVEYQYETTALSELLGVGAPAQLGLGAVVMLLGAVMMSQSLSMEVA